MSTEIPKDLPVGTTAFPASATRPPGYPAELPFVAEVGCLVTRLSVPGGMSVVTCVWTVEDEEAMWAHRERMRAAEQMTRTLSIRSELDQVEQRAATSSPAELTRLSAELDQILAAAPEEDRDTIAAIREMHLAAVRPSPARVGVMEGIADVIVGESMADGWEVVSDRPRPFPPGSRDIEMRRAGLKRTIASSPLGYGGHVMLAETPARNG